MTTLPSPAQDNNPSFIPASPGIYKITCTANGKIYIGSAVNLRKRQIYHFSDLRRNKHGNAHLQNAWNKYGEQAFTFEVLEFVLVPEMLTAQEQYWFTKLRPFGKRGFNIARNAEAPRLGLKHAPETRAKMGLANVGNTYRLGSKASPETIERLRQSHLGKPSNWRGHHHTPETIEKVRQARKGQKMHPHPFKPNAYRVKGDIGYIRLTKGKEAIISTVDLEHVLQVRWYTQHDQRTGNYRAIGKLQGERVTLNRHIMGAQEDEWVDHLNGNTLDNRHENLRLSSTPNLEKALSTSKTGIRGVSLTTSHGMPRYKFSCQFASCKVQKRFPHTEEGLAAAKAYAEAHYAAMKK